MAQLTREQDPWMGPPSGGSRYTEPQRRKMIDARIGLDGRGCSCKGCAVHPKGPCPLATIAPSVDVYKVLTVHEINGPGHLHLSEVRAFCQPCNRNTKPTAPSTQHTRVSVRKSPGAGRESVGTTTEPSARLVQRHEWERPAWDEWIVTDRPWRKLREENLMEGEWALLQDLIDLAAGELVDPTEGKGSSVTFRRYAMEDRFTVLEMARTKGRLYVRVRKEGRQK
jgi:hypothetical protein